MAITYQGGPIVSAPYVQPIEYYMSAVGDDGLSDTVGELNTAGWLSRFSEYDTNVTGGTGQTIGALTYNAPISSAIRLRRPSRRPLWSR